uniref:Uncharacterized protein n=1 Tax=Romanomermis culicivorax TaxID=13658 RepID=A0A915IW81_ROMCU
EYDLQILNVQLSDEDIYQCQILAAGPEQPLQKSDKVKLTVLVPSTAPRFVDLNDEGETLQGREGYPLSARCISQGGKPEASLEFYISTDRTGENLVRHLVQDTPYEIMTHNELNDIESSIK